MPRAATKKTVGRTLSLSTVKRQKGITNLLIVGDRGRIELKLTDEEAENLFADGLVDDKMRFTITLPEGNVKELYESWKNQSA